MRGKRSSLSAATSKPARVETTTYCLSIFLLLHTNIVSEPNISILPILFLHGGLHFGAGRIKNRNYGSLILKINIRHLEKDFNQNQGGDGEAGLKTSLTHAGTGENKSLFY